MTRHAITGRWGLQGAMTATYVAVTAAAVLLTELVILGMALLAPQRSTPLLPQQVQQLTQATAAGLAAKLAAGTSHSAGSGQLAGTSWEGRLATATLGTAGLPVTPGKALLDGTGGVAIPVTTSPVCDLAPASFAVAISAARTVLATSYPACFPVGGTGADTLGGAPGKALVSFGWPAGGGGLTSVPDGRVAWAAAPVAVPAAAPKGPGTGNPGTASVIAMVYVEVPAAASRASGVSASPALLWSGLVVLAASVPVGLAFGLLSTRRLTRRLQALAQATLDVADGEFGHRVPVSGHDEVSRLEDNFNRMAGQLHASLAGLRQLAEAGARQDERSRIARELHDSVSQELFSIQAMAGGLRRTLPPGSGALPAVETMERTAGGAMREMQALLLALRPVALEQDGLASAIEGICRACTERLGVRVRAELDPMLLAAGVLSPAVEHAVLRVTQEAVANAVRHSGAELVTVRLLASTAGTGHDHPGPPAGQDLVVLEVADAGRGFDVPAQQAGGTGLGLRVMHERAAEHGGLLSITSAAATGTVVRACFPREA